jgi:hypothetical protein
MVVAKSILSGPQIRAHGPVCHFSYTPERSCQGSMEEDVFALYRVMSGTDFPFSVKDYQHYVFGDDRLAHRFGTDLAKAFIAHGPGSTTTVLSDQSPTSNLAVAVLSGYVPTATHSLRNHFSSHLNQYLVSVNAKPAVKIDIHVEEGSQAGGAKVYHVDRGRIGGRSIIILGDIRLSQSQEDHVKQSFRSLQIDNPITFVYLASIPSPANSTTLAPILSLIVSPAVKDVENIAQGHHFVMNECFVRFILGRDEEYFCRFLRRQDDSFARLLLDYSIGGQYYEDELYQQNVKFLQWEIRARDSI